MKQLSGLDASFLYLETPQMPMHVAALHVFELPRGQRGRFVSTLRKHIASRLPAAPALRRKLWCMPLNLANPAWVDAEPDLKQHIVEIKLKKGANLHALEEQGKLHTRLLDRGRPLWKFHVFEGLVPAADGTRRVGLYTQVHHAAVGGQAAGALANAILDLSPEPRAIEARASRPRKLRFGIAEMVSGALANQVQQVGQMLRALPSTLGTLGGAATQALERRKGSVRNLALAPRTRLNVSLSEQRAFAGVSLPLLELKGIAKAHQAT